MLFLGAGLLGLLSIAVPHDPTTTVSGVAAVSAFSLAVALAVLLSGPMLNLRTLSALLGLGTLLVSAAILTTGGVPNASSALYTWICLYAAYVLRRRDALLHVALIGCCYGGVVSLSPPDFPPAAHWTTTMGTLLGATLLVSALRARLEMVIACLDDAARTDPLTGLLNRRGFQDALDREFSRSRRNDRHPALVMVDIDHFKRVNDALGHAAGDDVLCDLADTLRREARGADVAARLGGEEFALLLPETTAEGAVVVAERMRAALTERLSRSGMTVTASLGVAAAPTHGVTLDELMAAADRALYAAKRGGRNRVVRCPDGLARAPLTL